LRALLAGFAACSVRADNGSSSAERRGRLVWYFRGGFYFRARLPLRAMRPCAPAPPPSAAARWKAPIARARQLLLRRWQHRRGFRFDGEIEGVFSASRVRGVALGGCVKPSSATDRLPSRRALTSFSSVRKAALPPQTTPIWFSRRVKALAPVTRLASARRQAAKLDLPRHRCGPCAGAAALVEASNHPSARKRCFIALGELISSVTAPEAAGPCIQQFR